MILKKMLWVIKRHPFLYRTRFRLLANNSNIGDLKGCSYNSKNKAKEIPSIFYKINERIFLTENVDSDLPRVKHLGVWLMDNIKGGPGLSEPSDKALKMMLEGKGGVCSDMAQIFNNFCVINELKVREWGTTRLPFDKEFGGHSFNEVFVKELDKWVLVDVYYCVLFKNKSNELLSTVEFYEDLRKGDRPTFISFHPSLDLDRTKILKNYYEEGTAPFLICNYSNKWYDKALKISRPYVPVFVTHFIMYIIGRSYYYKFPLDNYKSV